MAREINSRDLDNWITGHYGEDQFRNERSEVEDEGITILQNAMSYLLEQIGDEDEWNEVEGELMHLIRQIENDYICQECSAPIKKNARFCSRTCYLASTI